MKNKSKSKKVEEITEHQDLINRANKASETLKRALARLEYRKKIKEKASPEKLIEIAKKFKNIALEANRTHYEIFRAINSIYSILNYSILNKCNIKKEIMACMSPAAVTSFKAMENNFLKVNVFIFKDTVLYSIFQTRNHINSAHNLVPKFDLSADFIQKLTDELEIMKEPIAKNIFSRNNAPRSYDSLLLHFNLFQHLYGTTEVEKLQNEYNRMEAQSLYKLSSDIESTITNFYNRLKDRKNEGHTEEPPSDCIEIIDALKEFMKDCEPYVNKFNTLQIINLQQSLKEKISSAENSVQSNNGDHIDFDTMFEKFKKMSALLLEHAFEVEYKKDLKKQQKIKDKSLKNILERLDDSTAAIVQQDLKKPFSEDAYRKKFRKDFDNLKKKLNRITKWEKENPIDNRNLSRMLLVDGKSTLSSKLSELLKVPEIKETFFSLLPLNDSISEKEKKTLILRGMLKKDPQVIERLQLFQHTVFCKIKNIDEKDYPVVPATPV